MTDSTALDSFLDKWRSRWPEWRVVEVFVPAHQRQLAVAWFALQQEFSDALNIAGDPLPADAKLAWWGEELRDWNRQRSRHPLGRVLEPHAAAWFELAEALPVLIGMRAEQPSLDAALAALQPLADALSRVESSLFQQNPAAPAVHLLSFQLLSDRVLSGKEQQSQPEGPLLLARWPVSAGAALPRRLWSGLARERLQRSVGRPIEPAPLPPVRALWAGWRAARGR